jgi:integrase
VRIVPRTDNANGARAKTRAEHDVPISVPLARLYSEYMHAEYGLIGSDYVFVNLWSAPLGRPLRYQAVAGLVGRLRARTGIDFNLHMLRHARTTEWLRRGVAIEVVSKLLTHASVATTSSTYAHLDVSDLRAELVRAGVWAGPGAQ